MNRPLGLFLVQGVADLCEVELRGPVWVFAINGGGTTAVRMNFARAVEFLEQTKLVYPNMTLKPSKGG